MIDLGAVDASSAATMVDLCISDKTLGGPTFSEAQCVMIPTFMWAMNHKEIASNFFLVESNPDKKCSEHCIRGI